MATKLLNGKLREVWDEAVPHPGGAGGVVRTITTGIRVKRLLTDGSRLRGFIYLTKIQNRPSISGTFSIAANGTVVLTITNASVNATDTATYTVDIQLLHSIQQANDGTLLPNGTCFTLVNSDLAGNIFLHEASHLNAGTDEILQAVRVDAVGVPIVAGDHTVLGNNAGPIGMTLPAAVAAIVGREYVIKNINVGTITVTRAGVDLIDGAVNFTLPNQYDTVTIKCTAAGVWSIVERYLVPAAHAATHRNGGGDEILLPIRTPPAGAYVALPADRYIRMDSGGAPVACTLYPAGAGDVGREITVMKVDAPANAINVTPDGGGDTINGVAALVALPVQWTSITLLCVAAGAWEIVAVTP